jgi:tetratricopeptide (TPR) repeat protein
LLGRNGRHPEAISDYEAAIRLKPNQWQAYYNRAADFRDSGKLEEALNDLNKVAELNPTFVPVYLGRADIHIRRHEVELAIQDCDKAASIDPKSPAAYRTRATAHRYRHEYVAALHDLEQATQLQTLHPESALNSLAWFCATCPDPQARDGAKAIAAASKACQLTKWANWEAIDTLAAAYAEAGQFDEASKYQKEAIALTPRGDASIGSMQQRLQLYHHHHAYHEDQKN